jgi:hypothetical protein
MYKKLFRSGPSVAIYLVVALFAMTAIGFQNCARIDFGDDDVVDAGNNTGLGTPPNQPLECSTQGGVENVLTSIRGPIELEQGESAPFSLPGLENCDNRFAISWYTTDRDQTGANPSPVTSGPSFRVGFGLPGVYVVVARVLDSNLRFKDITHQVLVREKCRSGSACNDEIGRAAIRGRTVGYVGDLYRFEVSTKTPIQNLVWFFGNSSSRSANGRTDIDLSFRVPGIHTIRAEFEDSSGKKQVLTHYIQILERDKVPGEGPCDDKCDDDDDKEPPPSKQCDLSRLDLSGPSTLGVNEKARWALYLPDCLKSDIEQIDWIVDSAEPQLGDSSKEMSFDSPGLRVIKARVRIKRPLQGSEHTDITLSRPVWVIEEQCRIEVPPVQPPPVPPNSCFPLKEGESVEEVVGISYRDLACGTDGTKRTRYDLVRSRTCEKGRVVLSTPTEKKVSEGACVGQSCLLQGGLKLKDKQSAIRYSMKLPGDSCKNHEVTLTCANGSLNQSDKDLHESCLSGCPGVGVHGSQAFAFDSEEQVAKMCPFGEAGFYDRYKTEKQLQCADGTIIDTGVRRRGDLIEAGNCPTYAWKLADWTSCSAECGGEQSAIYTCHDNTGAMISNNVEAARRCGPVPTQIRACSRNPDSRYDETRLSYLPGSAVCPKNQIGAIITRVETVTTYMCQNHKYEKVAEVSNNTTENYCKPYQASRCSHDSLSPSQALGRYAWMKKCEPSVPMIADFFEKMKGIKESPEEIFKKSYKVDSNGKASYDRMTYATFMKADGKPWSAPAPGTTDYTKREALPDVSKISCEIPAGTTIAAVCLSSCLTPSQSLAVDLNGGEMSILEAMTSGVTSLPALTSSSSIGDVHYRAMKVDKFVTELIDSQHVILAIKTAKGRSIEVTPNHPVLISTGVLVEAKELTRGHELVGRDGQPDAIVQIEEKSHFGKVYNVFMASSVPEENLVLSQDLIIGSGHFQNEGSEFINRTILRQKLVEGALK